ncbi:glycosyltransferase [Nocardioides sp. GCM10027113]|uniref:glycosyltransferase n=1 Tax=unclassified Nocardioides TaxID=2615069 RepID=UPI003606F83D
MTPSGRLVMVMVGTDHHPFDRLVAWADAVALRNPGLRVVVQHGATRAPRRAEGHAFLPIEEIRRLLDDADAVVCHGGPGTIMDARAAGHVPLCVPRDPALGEHVDGHQQRFAPLVAEAGLVHHVLDEGQLHALLAGALAVPVQRRTLPTSEATLRARERLAAELDALA